MAQQPRVLVIEDDVQQSRVIQLRLKKYTPPFSVDSAHDVPAAFELLAKNAYDVVTLDYHLPSMTGLDALQAIKKQYPQVPVVMLTGQGDEQIAVQAMRMGAQDYLTKAPEHFELLPRVLARAIRENQLSQQLEQSRRRYYDLFHNANLAIFVIDAETMQIMQSNESAKSLLLHSEDVLRQKAFFNIVSPEQQTLIETLIDNIQKNGRAQAENVLLMTAEKHPVPTDISGSLVHSGDHRLIELFVTDISEKLRMHRQLQLSQQRLLALFNGITDLICVLDGQFTLHMGNKRYLEFTGNTVKSLVSKKCHEALFGLDSPCQNCPAVLTQKSGNNNFYEMYHKERVYHIWTFPMRNLAGQPEFVVEYLKDVTEQKDMERQFIKSEKLASIGLLSSGIAHELRNPLNIIESARYAVELELDHRFPEVDKKLRTIRASILRASAIIDNLLHFSRHSQFTRERVDVNALVRSTLSLMSEEIKRQHVKVIYALAESPRVFVNIDSLKQVFLNVILNAVQAMPNGGELNVRTASSEDGEWVLVEFCDSGPGIDPANLPHIFTPFFTTKGPTEGTGLGLYISYTLIKREGGDLQCRSEVGKGSTFIVKLPVAKAEDTVR